MHKLSRVYAVHSVRSRVGNGSIIGLESLGWQLSVGSRVSLLDSKHCLTLYHSSDSIKRSRYIFMWGMQSEVKTRDLTNTTPRSLTQQLTEPT